MTSQDNLHICDVNNVVISFTGTEGIDSTITFIHIIQVQVLLMK